MKLLLKNTLTGMLWRATDLFPEFVLPANFCALKEALEIWYYKLPIHVELRPVYDRMGSDLARRVSVELSCDVEYRSAWA